MHLPLLASINGKPLGRPNAGRDMTFSFPDLIAHAARTRRLGAGSIIGSGTVSNKDGDGPGKPVDQGGAGYTCLAEVRTVETILEGKPNTPFLQFGDRVRIEMRTSPAARSSAPSSRRWCATPRPEPRCVSAYMQPLRTGSA